MPRLMNTRALDGTSLFLDQDDERLRWWRTPWMPQVPAQKKGGGLAWVFCSCVMHLDDDTQDGRYFLAVHLELEAAVFAIWEVPIDHAQRCFAGREAPELLYSRWKGDQGAKRVLERPNAERDSQIFKWNQAGMSLKEIKTNLDSRKEFDPITVSRIQQIITAQSERRGVAKPPRLKPGRKKSSKPI